MTTASTGINIEKARIEAYLMFDKKPGMHPPPMRSFNMFLTIELPFTAYLASGLSYTNKS